MSWLHQKGTVLKLIFKLEKFWEWKSIDTIFEAITLLWAHLQAFYFEQNDELFWIIVCCVFQPANGVRSTPFAGQNHFFGAKTTLSVNLHHEMFFKGVYQRSGVTLKLHMFLCGFLFFFLYFVPLVTEKVVLPSNKLILTSERRAEHPFAGRNTQQLSNFGWLVTNKRVLIDQQKPSRSIDFKQNYFSSREKYLNSQLEVPLSDFRRLTDTLAAAREQYRQVHSKMSRQVRLRVWGFNCFALSYVDFSKRKKRIGFLDLLGVKPLFLGVPP